MTGMFHRHHAPSATGAVMTPQMRSVRLLRSDEELVAAVERAKAFELRNAHAQHKRGDSHDHLLRRTEAAQPSH
jgi:hypothetical protein